MIMQDIKISIVIPIYNVAPYVEECIQSVMNQTWKGKLECILVDDCGTDDSMKVATEKLKEYEGNIDFRVIRHERNRGLSAARNSGIDAVTGDYVYFLDSDDEITPDCIDLLVQPLDFLGIVALLRQHLDLLVQCFLVFVELHHIGVQFDDLFVYRTDGGFLFCELLTQRGHGFAQVVFLQGFNLTVETVDVVFQLLDFLFLFGKLVTQTLFFA